MSAEEFTEIMNQREQFYRKGKGKKDEGKKDEGKRRHFFSVAESQGLLRRLEYHRPGWRRL